MQRKFRIPVRRLLDSTMADNSMIDDFNIIAERLFRTEQIPASSPVPLNCAPLGRVMFVISSINVQPGMRIWTKFDMKTSFP